jgi:DNA-binding GntR family transcriptional regulator
MPKLAASLDRLSTLLPLQRESRTPMHRQIAQQLREAVASGHFGPGDKTPTEPELSAYFGVSRITARKAVEILAREGVLVRQQGKGTFVQGPVVRHDLLELRGIYDELVKQGLKPEIQLLDYGHIVPKVKIADKLETGERKVLHWQRLYLLNGRPFGLSIIHMDAAGIDIDRETATRLPTYEILRSVLHLEVERADVAIRYEQGRASICRTMGFPVGTPLMVLERVSYSAEGKPREHTLYYAKASSYEFSIMVRGPMNLVTNLKHYR